MVDKKKEYYKTASLILQDFLRRRRRASNLSFQDVASAADFCELEVARFERFALKTPTNKLMKLARALDDNAPMDLNAALNHAGTYLNAKKIIEDHERLLAAWSYTNVVPIRNFLPEKLAKIFAQSESLIQLGQQIDLAIRGRERRDNVVCLKAARIAKTAKVQQEPEKAAPMRETRFARAVATTSTIMLIGWPFSRWSSLAAWVGNIF